MSTFFTSDLHLGHAYTTRTRGFSVPNTAPSLNEIQEHDEFILDTLETQLTKRDLLFILGDVSFSLDGLYQLARLPARMVLVRGNHDTFKTEHYCKIFEEIYGFVGYKEFWLSHAPVHPQEIYRKEGNIHGHIHKDSHTQPLPFPYFNVNWDFHHKAIRLENIREWFDSVKTAKGDTQ